VEQRAAALHLTVDTVSFDALGDTIRLAFSARDRLDAPIASAPVSYSSTDTAVVTVGADGLVRSRDNGGAYVIARSPDGPADSAQVSIAQRVEGISVDRDSVLFESLQAVQPVRTTPIDRLGATVRSATVSYTTADADVAAVDTLGRVRAMGNGTTRVVASAGGHTVTTQVRVSQRAVRVSTSADTIRLDALGDTQVVRGVAFDSLGSTVSGAASTVVVDDAAVVEVLDSITVRARSNGTTVLKVTVAGLHADVIASVLQVPTQIVASLETADSVVDLPIGSIIPLTCEARDRNDYTVLDAPSVKPSSDARWIGTRCDNLRALRSGFDTLRLAAGSAQASLSLDLVVRPPELPNSVPVVARVTAGPDETFLSWIQQDAEANIAEVWLRTLGTSSWDQKDVPHGRSWLALQGYAPGTSVEVALAFTDNSGSVRNARVDTVMVRDADTCHAFAGYASTDLRVFCTGPDLLNWVSARGLDPQSVRCGNESLVTLRDGLPNCVYEAGSERFVLLRGLDDRFQASSSLPRSLLRTAYLHVLFGLSSPEATLWQADPAIGAALPIARVGAVTGYRSAISWNTEVNSVGIITWFEPPNPNGAIAIYHEGHSGDATETGAETISWLLQRGWSVIALNPPRVPHMYLRDLHSGEDNPLWRMLYGIGQVTEWIHRSWAPGRDPVVVAIGHSGGGWASLLYAALDERIDATAVVSGFVPVSQRLELAGLNVGDWEQIDPSTFGVLDYTDIVRLADTRELLLSYSELDDCCFRLSAANPFAQWLVAEAEGSPARLATVISSGSQHGLSPEGYAALQELLDRALARGH